MAEQVDVVEPIAKFTEGLKEKLGVGSIFNIGLEEWTPTGGTIYDLVWTQWCVGHLTDAQLVGYLRRCAETLGPGGVIVVKENLTTSGVDIFDENDSSVTRSVKQPASTIRIESLIGLGPMKSSALSSHSPTSASSGRSSNAGSPRISFPCACMPSGHNRLASIA